MRGKGGIKVAVFTDLTGQRVGELEVLEELAPMERGYRRIRAYLCRCSCGTEQRIEHRRLIARPGTQQAVDRCDTCRYTRTCKACGDNFVSQQYKATCSQECLREHKRQIQLEAYYRRFAKDPDINRRNYRRKQELMAADPKRAALHRERELERSRRRRANMTPEEIEADRERLRRHYRENSTEIQRARKERFLAKPPEERALIYARWLQNNRDWYAAHREQRREQRRIMFESDPEGWRAYQRERRRIRKEHQAQAEFAELAKALHGKLTEQD